MTDTGERTILHLATEVERKVIDADPEEVRHEVERVRRERPEAIYAEVPLRHGKGIAVVPLTTFLRATVE